MRRLLALAVVAAALAGCFAAPPVSPPTAGDSEEPPAAASPAPSEPDTYRFVEATGTYRAEGRGVSICGYPSPPHVDRDARTIRFANERVDPNATAALLVGVVWDSSACGLAVTVVDAGADPHATLRDALPGFEEFAVSFLDDGAVEALGERIAPGESREFAASGERADGTAWRANLTVTNHGAWPRSGLQPAAA